jgi:hypothetical protein
MSTKSGSLAGLRLSPLAFAFAGLCAFPVAPAMAGDGGSRLYVTSCADDGSEGTLRSVAATATFGDTIDLTRLQCSRITLEQGALDFGGPIVGPGRNRLTIDGNYLDRVFNASTLDISGVTITHGVSTGDVAGGGCVLAMGVTLVDVAIVGCTAHGVTSASGGAINSQYLVKLTDSVLSGNVAISDSGFAVGGGIAAFYGSVVAETSEISDNAAIGSAGSIGGGFFVEGPLRLVRSTIGGNTADRGGGFYKRHGIWTNGDSAIVESTISGNTANESGGGAYVSQTYELDISSSTIAFNTATSGNVGGILIANRPGASYARYAIQIGSTIIANNSAPASVLAADIDILHADSVLTTGDADIVTTVGQVVPNSYMTADPLLAPLANNGGPTRTHALLAGSPAIDTGFDAANLGVDQRGSARVAGAQADIGAYELQPDAMFSDGFDGPD